MTLRRIAALLLVAVAAGFGACTFGNYGGSYVGFDGGPGQPCGGNMGVGTPCANGLVCAYGVCRPACPGTGCPSGTRCLPVPEVNGSTLNACVDSAPCNNVGPCNGGSCECAAGAECAPDHQCRVSCMATASNAGPSGPSCPAGEVCAVTQPGCKLCPACCMPNCAGCSTSCATPGTGSCPQSCSMQCNGDCYGPGTSPDGGVPPADSGPPPKEGGAADSGTACDVPGLCPTPGSVLCNQSMALSCATMSGAPVCCSNGGGPGSCMMPTGCLNYEVDCEEAADCAPNQVCCAFPPNGGPPKMGCVTASAGSCPYGVQLCRTNAECGGPQCKPVGNCAGGTGMSDLATCGGNTLPAPPAVPAFCP